MEQPFQAFLDAAEQVAEVAIEHSRRVQMLNEAALLYQKAISTRTDRAALLLELEKRAERLSPETRRSLLSTVASIMRDHVAFDEACLQVLSQRKRT